MIVRIQAGSAPVVRETWNVHGERLLYEHREQVVSAQVMGQNLANHSFWVFWKHCCSKEAQ